MGESRDIIRAMRKYHAGVLRHVLTRPALIVAALLALCLGCGPSLSPGTVCTVTRKWKTPAHNERETFITTNGGAVSVPVFHPDSWHVQVEAKRSDGVKVTGAFEVPEAEFEKIKEGDTFTVPQ